MTDAANPVTEDDLHAYADAQLSNGELARVEAWLRDHPHDAEKVRQWQAQNCMIQTLFEPYRAASPGDTELFASAADIAPAPASSPWRMRGLQVAAGICLFVLGAVTGHFVPFGNADRANADAGLHQEASSAFLIYASEVRHPVEVKADEKDHLVKWLSKKLGHQLAAPDLSARGFSLVGGRLVPVNGKAGALMMYEDAAGKRLTILVGQSEANAITSFRFAAQGSVETFYWIDEKLSYAVTGEIPRDVLRRVADDCYRQFETL
ncbi:anti-sigma factor [Rhizobium sp. TH2]|uniref:anti-sigma factor family protein n=1 Tax=Rhizobium sp. TH2 TaxID=2775403 RepID=UPI00215816E4|nr:anti-sigma factor [Rhizobium sp. TH2]UVC06703.1 anti-sigma factor [Rhizobium sp. TH2]